MIPPDQPLNTAVFKSSDLIKCYRPPSLLSVMPGNKVMLGSSGPCMIVADVDKNGDAVCQFEDDGKLVQYTFPLAMLTCFGAE